ncbi:MAG: hypothetical protein E4H40_06580 [Candidatus Brocadiia bacterium]|nr:MAG: hypothetical protein E4H40_06580 [Candidatus Brocadiia bacterium]
MESDNSLISGEDKAERNFGEQPISRIMAEHNLRAHDLVAESSEQLTHKMVSRGRKGRKLTANSKMKLLKALNRRTGKSYTLEELFNY